MRIIKLKRKLMAVAATLAVLSTACVGIKQSSKTDQELVNKHIVLQEAISQENARLLAETLDKINILVHLLLEYKIATTENKEKLSLNASQIIKEIYENFKKLEKKGIDIRSERKVLESIEKGFLK